MKSMDNCLNIVTNINKAKLIQEHQRKALNLYLFTSFNMNKQKFEEHKERVSIRNQFKYFEEKGNNKFNVKLQEGEGVTTQNMQKIRAESKNEYDPLNIVTAPENEEESNLTEKTINLNKILTIDYNKSISKQIVEMFKYEEILNLENKIILTNFILEFKRHFLPEKTEKDSKIYEIRDQNSEFYEEECHLRLIKWLLKIKKNEKEFLKNYFLINNILNIFELIPVNINDLFQLKIYRKLNKLKSKLLNFPNLKFLTFKLENLLKFYSESNNYKFLGKKQKRTISSSELLAKKEEEGYVYCLLSKQEKNFDIVSFYF